MKQDPEEYKEFDERFGTKGPEGNCDSTGRGAGCDDCSVNIKLREEHRQFLKENFIPKSTLKKNIGMLRQWLNEKPANFRLLTNEDLEKFLLEQQ